MIVSLIYRECRVRECTFIRDYTNAVCSTQKRRGEEEGEEEEENRRERMKKREEGGGRGEGE